MVKERVRQAARGLSEAEVIRSRKEHGANVLSQGKKRGFLSHFFSNLGDPVIRILLGALVVNLIFVFRGGDVFETVGIGVSVFLATLISTLSERGSEAAFARLSELCARACFRVRRDGAVHAVDMADIVVGDVILIGAGEQIPADAYVIEGTLVVDQSSMTGENREVEKRPSTDRSQTPNAKSALFRGSTVLSGEGEICVFAVGDATFLGQISQEVQIDTRESPLKVRLGKLAKQISRLGYFAAVLIGLAYLFHTLVIDSSFHMPLILLKLRNTPYLLQTLLHAVMLSLTVIVVAVPEGLPMMIAVVLSANIRRMVRDQVLVRKPAGIEAAGSMNILFTDKTGTLTQGRMSVGRILLADGTEPTCAAELAHRAPVAFSRYALSCTFNGGATMVDGHALGGNATDRALLESVGTSCVTDGIRVATRIPFDSVRKISAVTLTGKTSTVLVKGAPERLLPLVRDAYLANGRIVPFATHAYEVMQKIGNWTKNGERVIVIAEAERMQGGDFGALTLICAVSLCDRIRPEARAAVRELQGAGIGIVMITGDNRDTAASIARECGILTRERDLVLTGEELAALSDDRLRGLLGRLAVVSRALPTDKSRLVRLAQEAELVVGMTGDGINDAPALKRADIGFAMGGGTQVAKDAGDIIILDNNLSSIAKAVLYGRTIFKSIRKFITLQLTMNFCAVAVSMIGPFVGIDAPVTVVQMLWINIIMDTLGGLAFAGEAPLASYMKEKPKRRDEPILNGYMIHQILLLGGFTVALCLGFLLHPHITSHFRPAPDKIYRLTAFFALFIFTSVFNCFASRTDRFRLLAGIGKNKPFLCIMAAVLGVQIAFVYLGGDVLRTAPLTASELLYTFLMSLLVIPAEGLRKILWRLKGRSDGF